MGTLVKRTASGVLFCLVVIGCCLNPWGLAALVCLLSAALSFEFWRMTVERRFVREMVCVALASLTLLVLLFLHLQFGLGARWLTLAFLPVTAASVFMLFDGAEHHDFPSAVYFPLVYFALPLSSMLLLAWPGGVFCWRILLGLIVLMWMNDIGAYVLGMGFGQRPDSRKLFPALSPKKSWIGVVGGTLFTFASAWAIYATFGGAALPLVHWMGLALVVSVFGVFGDLFESLIKRHAQVKDAGNIIPGHGGLLDRFDDVVFVLPVALIYLEIFSLL
ncbi:MAG: phosphatidate cytidylyltransferase [Bacteroidales bacterium]|nr:phosphatidate cytidylyltransferase [Bacteroidales bacterium]